MTAATEQTGERRDTVELTISARPENLAIARLALAGVAATAGASREVVADMKLAVTEACTNAIQHAYGSGGDGDILVRYTVGEGTLSIEVEDRGAGFEPGAPSTNVERNGEGHGGMGLMIIRMLTDELSIKMGSVYFSRLYNLQQARLAALKNIVLRPPAAHPPTPACNGDVQRELSRAWAFAAAQIVWTALPSKRVFRCVYPASSYPPPFPFPPSSLGIVCVPAAAVANPCASG